MVPRLVPTRVPNSVQIFARHFVRHLHSILECRTTKGAKTKNETDLTSVEIHITCRCNQRALWAVSILERHPIAKPTASRSNLNYVSLQTSHFSNQGFCAASCQPFQIFAEHKMRHPISKPTAGRSKFKTRVAPNNASVGTQLYRATRNIENDRRKVEISNTCRYILLMSRTSFSAQPAA